MTKSVGGGDNPPAPNSGGLVPSSPVIYAHGSGNEVMRSPQFVSRSICRNVLHEFSSKIVEETIS